MNPRRNLKTRKNRRKRNERWEMRGSIDDWINREYARNLRRFIGEHGVSIIRASGAECTRALLCGELGEIGCVEWGRND